MIIYVSIISRLPQALLGFVSGITTANIFSSVIFILLALAVIVAVVIVNEGTRNISIEYGRRGKTSQKVSNYLPLKINQAGVIPIIFAISFVLFPPLVAQFFSSSSVTWLATFATWLGNLFNNPWFYASFYFILVVAFTYFYTAVIFKPDEIAENLQKQGAFVPGIRPGEPTADYLQKTSSRILLTGALFLGIIAVLPYALQSVGTVQTMVVGGTSLLIVVSVVIETVKQIESQLVMRDYEGF